MKELRVDANSSDVSTRAPMRWSSCTKSEESEECSSAPKRCSYTVEEMRHIKEYFLHHIQQKRSATLSERQTNDHMNRTAKNVQDKVKGLIRAS